MTGPDEKRGGGGRRDANETTAAARAKLDQLREEAGMPLRGDELSHRVGGEEGSNEPPLDWRLTPRNVILQLAAIALFVAVVWFLITLVADSLSVLFG